MQAAAPRHSPKPESDESDNDPDFVPDNAGDSDSSDDESRAKRPRRDSSEALPTQLTEEEIAAKRKVREALWADFQASVASSSSSSAKLATEPKLVKIEKRYRFAGEDVVEVKEVPEDSEEAQKWPRWHPPAEEGETSIERSSGAPDVNSSSSPSHPPPDATSTTASSTFPFTTQPTASTSTAAHSATPTPTSSSTHTPSPAPRKPPPGRRKSKVQLSDLPSSSSNPKAKKLTTLEKSSMDWKNHLGSGPSELQDELEANRRAGGYLEKVSFLQRVEERKEEVLEASKDRKRRRG